MVWLIGFMAVVLRLWSMDLTKVEINIMLVVQNHDCRIRKRNCFPK